MRVKPIIKFVLVSTVLAATTACHNRNSDPMAHLDADMRKVIEAHASLAPKPIETLTPKEARLQPTPADAVKKVLADQGKNPNDPMGVVTRDIDIDGAAGKIKARIYSPNNGLNDKNLPVVVYYHGGGFVIADVNVYDATPRVIAKGANAIVVSVEYRHAPENRFPAAHDDAFAAYKWVLLHAQSIGADASRIALLGESAGGNLAINTAITARNNGVQLPLYQALVYPVAGTNMDTPSYIDSANAKPLNKAMMSWFLKYALRSENNKKDPRIDIIGYGDVTNLPPTTIITAEADPLRSDGELLANKLQRSGVPTEIKEYKGVTHEFFGMGAVVKDAKDAEDFVIEKLKIAFKK